MVVKVLLYSITGIIILIILLLACLSIASHKSPPLGVQQGRLRPCPATPNCVSSEVANVSSYVAPLAYTTNADIAWQKAIQVIKSTGGDIVSEKPGYLHARYVTRWFRFIDDVELRLDKSEQQIQIRSASRVGRSDLGKNRQRVEKIRAAWLP